VFHSEETSPRGRSGGTLDGSVDGDPVDIDILLRIAKASEERQILGNQTTGIHHSTRSFKVRLAQWRIDIAIAEIPDNAGHKLLPLKEIAANKRMVAVHRSIVCRVHAGVSETEEHRHRIRGSLSGQLRDGERG